MKPAEDTHKKTNEKALEAMLARIQRKGDFPAMSENITTICRLTSKESASVDELANAILDDFSTTNKLLKVVNSVYYNQYGQEISTISRAVILLGFQQVRNAATSLMLFEGLMNKSHAAELRDSAYAAFFSGVIARELAEQTGIEDHEEARICAMFHSLGKLLVQFYLPEEYAEIRKAASERHISETRACRAVLGFSLEDFGTGIAKIWRFPDRIIASMQEPNVVAGRKPANTDEKMAALSGFANELCRITSSVEPSRRDEALKALSDKFKQCFTLTEKQIDKVLNSSFESMTGQSELLNINVKSSRLLRRIKGWTKFAEPGDFAGAVSVTDAAVSGDYERMRGAEESDGEAAGKAEDPKTILIKGIQDITNTLMGEFSMDNVFRMILETMYRAMNFSHVLLCVKDPRKPFIGARFGFGRDIDKLVKLFAVPVGPSDSDIFNRAYNEAQDIIITDIDNHADKASIPLWYRRLLKTTSVMILPISIGKVTLGLFYADRIPSDGRLELSQDELTYLKVLRNQAILAVRQRR
ncbi:MAG: HDOD domain-containing protein [Nitrospirae bacterium]|nr:HDOD domain-containing protein [Nitrospirota bacterium]